ncbi:MAG TPA: glycosyltransferase, partial [Candidatus Elarobacter sp.]|nr:glycosyltransferase [Candidatus Elarobacter sp.]
MEPAQLTRRLTRCLYVWDSEYPWDVRAEKTCQSLTDAGFSVHIVARNRHRHALVEDRDEGTVHRMRPWRRTGAAVDAALSFPAFFNPRWLRLIAGTARAIGARVIIARDLPLCPTAIHVGRKLGVPVVLDMAENYAAMMRDLWRSGRAGPMDYFIRNPAAVRAIEAYCLLRVDHIFTVVEESTERLRQLGVPADRITVVSNTPPVRRAREAAPKTGTGRPLEIVYLGLLELPRGVGDLIDAMGELQRRRPADFRATVIGYGRDSEILERQARTLGLGPDMLRFAGRLPYADALELVRKADIGVIPHHATECWNTTIPNKLFDYMSLGLPVVSSDALPCARVLAETGAG